MAKILYLADPNSVHDICWIEPFSKDSDNSIYVLPRAQYARNFDSIRKSDKWQYLSPIRDVSTIRPFRTLESVKYLRSLVSVYEIDIIHIMYAEPNALWARWAHLLKVPMILTTRGTDVLKTIPSFFDKKDLLSRIVAMQYKKALNGFNHITCTSQRQIQSLKKIGVASPMQIVRTGVNFDAVKAANLDMKNTLGIHKPFIVMPRNMKPLYYHEFTLEAISMLDEKIKKDYTFIFINADTQDQEYFLKIKNIAANIAADIHFYPSFSREEILSLYKQATLVVMNPTSDGSPVSAMEAMACKVPVILPPLPYDEEIFESCLTFYEWNPTALKKSVEEIISLNKQALHGRLHEAYQKIYEQGNTLLEMNKISKLYQYFSEKSADHSR